MAPQTVFDFPPKGHVGLLAYDGETEKWTFVAGAENGMLSVTVLSSALPRGAATETTLLELHDRVGDETSPAAGTVNRQLADSLTELQSLLTELQLKADLTETQPVSAASLPLPSGAATAANQATMITALQLIDDLRNALDSVGTDELDVNIEDSVTLTVQSTGSDKIFAFESIVEEQVSNTNLNAGTNYLVAGTVGSGKVWKLTHITFEYIGISPTVVRVYAAGLATNLIIYYKDSPTSGRWYTWDGEIYMQVGDGLILEVQGATAGDDIYLNYAGVQMDAP